MKRITLTLTVDELNLLATLASEQLFRREFIDPRMPGNKTNPEELDFGKALIGRLRLMLGQGSRGATLSPAPVAECALTSRLKRRKGTPHAL